MADDPVKKEEAVRSPKEGWANLQGHWHENDHGNVALGPQ